MASQAQIEANRRNAQKSTGPKTEEGKAAVARNAVKHGLFCQFLILPGELEDELETLRQGIYKRLRPADELEKLYVERIVVAAWKIRRLLSCDPHCYELDRTPYRSLENAADMVRRDIEQQEQFQKLITTLERAMDRALVELNKLQKNRPEEEDLSSPATAPAPVIQLVSEENKPNPSQPPAGAPIPSNESDDHQTTKTNPIDEVEQAKSMKTNPIPTSPIAQPPARPDGATVSAGATG